MASNFRERAALPASINPIDALAVILTSTNKLDHVAYERDSTWFVGIGSQHSLVIDAAGTFSTITSIHQAEPIIEQIDDKSLSAVARRFVHEYAEAEFRVFGQAGFNYASRAQGIGFSPGEWPILTLMIPRVQLAIQRGSIEVVCRKEESLGKEVLQLIANGLSQPHAQPQATSVDISPADDSYVESVANAQTEIARGLYQKIILSRQIQLAQKVNMVQTLVQGRQQNTPKRAFFWDHSNYQACGFSPELVMLLEQGKLITEPLAGTRSTGKNEQQRSSLEKDLVNNPKEVIEHVISVKEAIDELNQVCEPGTSVIEDFMSVKVRGHVQHLGSRVAGKLRPDQDGWNAFDVLFPSITASGIPKRQSLEAIQRLEDSPRELYSGAILILDGSDVFEAALVLRSTFQYGTKYWIQAGAGIIAQSTPERELTETREKLASVAPYIVYEQPASGSI